MQGKNPHGISSHRPAKETQTLHAKAEHPHRLGVCNPYRQALKPFQHLAGDESFVRTGERCPQQGVPSQSQAPFRPVLLQHRPRRSETGGYFRPLEHQYHSDLYHDHGGGASPENGKHASHYLKRTKKYQRLKTLVPD